MHNGLRIFGWKRELLSGRVHFFFHLFSWSCRLVWLIFDLDKVYKIIDFKA
jgi:hypothetical protein